MVFLLAVLFIRFLSVSRIRQFNEWGQCAILTLLANYVPETDDELYDILNILEDRLKHSSSSVVLSAAKCFIDLTAGKKALKEPILLRLKSPFLTLISTAPNEIAYVVLTHFQYLVLLFEEEEESEVDHEQSLVVRSISSDYKLFFCAFTDPVYIKLTKLDVLGSIISQVSQVIFGVEYAMYHRCLFVATFNRLLTVQDFLKLCLLQLLSNYNKGIYFFSVSTYFSVNCVKRVK